MQYYPYLQKALNTAAKWHEGQYRKGIKYPYIVHPVAVAIILSRYTDNCNLLAAGFLHDFLEDVKGYGRTEIDRDFGGEVLRIVEEVTEEKTPGMSKEEERRTWKARKMKYLKKLEGDSFEGLMVCAADKIHNLHSLLEFYALKREEIWETFNAPKDEIIWYYGAVVEVLKRKLKSPIMEELEEVYGVFMKKVGAKPLEKRLSGADAFVECLNEGIEESLGPWIETLKQMRDEWKAEGDLERAAYFEKNRKEMERRLKCLKNRKK